MRSPASSLLAAFAICLGFESNALARSWATSAPITLDIASGVRESAGAELVTYDTLWVEGATATKISVNDAEVVQRSGRGEVEWNTRRPGVYLFQELIYRDGVLVDDSLTATFNVSGRDLVNAEVSFADARILCDGTAQTPHPQVSLNGEVLTEGVDYALSYENNTNAGVAKVIVTGLGGYHDEIERTFQIVPTGNCSLDIASGVREAKAEERLTYDSMWCGASNATHAASIDGGPLASGSGVGVDVWIPRAVGEHVATYRAYVDGVKSGDDLTAVFHVAGRDLVNAAVSLDGAMILYDGTPKEPKPIITYGGRVLEEGVDYTLSYANNVDPGMGVMTITGLGGFVDILAVPFEIRPAGICSLDIKTGYRTAKPVEILNYDAKWHGSTNANVRMQVRINDEIFGNCTGVGGMEWRPSEGGEYVVKLRTYVDDYLQSDTIETAYFGVPGGSLDNWNATVGLEHDAFVYDGQPKEPAVTVSLNGIALVQGGDYNISYVDNVNAGTAKVIVSGCGHYSGSITRTFQISPRPLAIAADAKSKTVGEPDPTLTFTADGLVAGDTITGALVRDAGEGVGFYRIRQGTLTAGGNYAISFTEGVFSIAAVAPSFTRISARQRYPWNGLVDVDVALEGNTGETYRIELSAADRIGGTNLTVATVWRKGAEGAVGNPVDVPAPGTHRLVWNAAADLPSGFIADRVAISANLLNPIWSFESIPAVDPNDEWAPATVYHDVQTVASYGEIENHAPTIRCLTDEWHLEDTLGSNVVFSGSSMGLREPFPDMLERGVEKPVSLWTGSDTTNTFRMVTLDYETGVVAYDNPAPYADPGADARFFSVRDGRVGRQFAQVCRYGWGDFTKSANTDMSHMFIKSRYGDDELGSAVCGYFPKGVPLSNSSQTSISSYDKGSNAAVFFCGAAGTDIKQAVVAQVGGVAKVLETPKYSCMKNPTGRYVVPMLDGESYFTAGHGNTDSNHVPFHRLFAGKFTQFNDERFDLGNRYREDWPVDYASWSQADKTARVQSWVREPSVAYSKGAAMPDGKRIFLGGTGRDFDGTIRMWQSGTNMFDHADYPAGHPFKSWARRDVTCLLPNGKFCGVDEELGLVVVNPLNGEMYVASDEPVFKKGKMGCQLLPNGKVWIIPYDCEGREYLAGTNLCGKLYEVDFGFTRSFSLSSLLSPYLKVAEGDPEPSGIKVGLDPNGGELPGIYAQYYKGANPVYGTLPTPARSGYAFRGWSTDGTEAGIVATTDLVPQSGIQLKAVWRAE